VEGQVFADGLGGDEEVILVDEPCQAKVPAVDLFAVAEGGREGGEGGEKDKELGSRLTIKRELKWRLMK